MDYFEAAVGSLPSIPEAVVTAGTFDGVHAGHRQILAKLVERAHSLGRPAVVLSYWPHPRFVLFPQQRDLLLLSTLEEKKALLAEVGIDALVVLNFTQEFAQLSSVAFMQQVLIDGLQASEFIVGYDHMFGKNREGSIHSLQDYAGAHGLALQEIPAHYIDAVAVSSSRIRLALSEGDCATANAFLGRAYTISGTVVKGKQLGRTIGYPTLNIDTGFMQKLLPKQGVYAVWVWVGGQRHGAMMNIGNRPTVSGIGITIEVHVFDFEADVYGQEVKVDIITYLREEQKFAGLEALTNALAADRQLAKAALLQA